MGRRLSLGALCAVVTLGFLAGPDPAWCEAKNRVAVPLDPYTFVTVKDDAEWEYVHLYKIEGGKLLLVDSVAVRQDHKIDRIIEFRRMAIGGDQGSGE